MHIDTIVTDLDDTLLNAQSDLSPYTLETLDEARRRGIRIIPASGRAASSMRPFVDLLNLSLPYIACNGAQLMNPDHTEILSITFTPEQAHGLIRYFTAKGFYTQVYRGDYFYFAKHSETNERYSQQTGMQGKAVGDLIAFLDFPTPKVLSVSTPEEVEKLFPIIQAEYPEYSFTISKPYFLEAQPHDVSKGSAMRRLSGILGFTPESTMAFGDSLNDLSMFDFAVHSVAMINARDEVKRAARYVTELPNAQDGLARFLRTHVLI